MPRCSIYVHDAEEIRCCLEAGAEMAKQRNFINEMKTVERKIDKAFKKASKKNEKYVRIFIKWLSKDAIETLRECGWDVYWCRKNSGGFKAVRGYIVTNRPRD